MLALYHSLTSLIGEYLSVRLNRFGSNRFEYIVSYSQVFATPAPANFIASADLVNIRLMLA